MIIQKCLSCTRQPTFYAKRETNLLSIFLMRQIVSKIYEFLWAFVFMDFNVLDFEYLMCKVCSINYLSLLCLMLSGSPHIPQQQL